MKKGFIKGEALRLLRTNSSQITFERNIRNFHNRLLERGYPAAILRKYLSEVKFADRKTALQQRNKSARKKLLPFVTQYHPALPSLKKILMGKWHLIQNQQRLREIFKEPPLISYRKGKSLKDLLVRAKLWSSYYFQYDLVQESCDARRLFLTRLMTGFVLKTSPKRVLGAYLVFGGGGGPLAFWYIMVQNSMSDDLGVIPGVMS